MLKGFVERRLSKRIPFETEIQIRFEKNNQELIKTTANNISAGGMQFSIPWGFEFANEGETLEVIFNLPLLGKTSIKGEIRHISFGIDSHYQRLSYYGIKFLDISPEIWNFILDFCNEPVANQEPSSTININKLKEYDRKDIRVETNLPANFVAANHEPVNGVIEDISYGGVRARAAKSFAPDEPVRVIIRHQGLELELNGICVWAQPNPAYQHQFSIGISFKQLNLDNFNKLRELIFKSVS
jgi:c-di-GMP-binding flagellar brake protein YcgR